MFFEILSTVLLWISGIFAILGALGMLKFPDIYTRSHAATLISMGGMSLALIALILRAPWSIHSAKVFLVLIINLFSNPTSTHIIANTAYKLGIKPKVLVRNEWNGKK